MLDVGPSRTSLAKDRRAVSQRPPVVPSPTAAAPEESAPSSRTTTTRARQPKRPLLMWRWIVGGSILLALLVAGAIWGLSKTHQTVAIDSSMNQAVFFANGQLYFGKLEILNDKYMRLTNVFYIQSNTTDQTTEKSTETQQPTTENNMQLIKLGNEVYGPQDEMIINRDQVLFFENLKSDGRVAELMRNYKSGNR